MLHAVFRTAFLFLFCCARALTGEAFADDAKKPRETARNLPAIGYCPPKATQPACSDALSAYQAAYQALITATDSYYEGLGPGIVPPKLSAEADSKAKMIRSSINDIAARLKALSDAVPSPRADTKLTFVDRLYDAQEARASWIQKNKTFVSDPLGPATGTKYRVIATQALDTYRSKLSDFFLTANSVETDEQKFKIAFDELEAIKRKVQTVIDALSRDGEVAKYARELPAMEQQAVGNLDQAFKDARDAAENAARAGVVFEERPKPSSGEMRVSIVDAIYGDQALVARIQNRWEAGGSQAVELKAFLPGGWAGRVCRALDDVVSDCEYFRTKMCLHKDYAANPVQHKDPKPCDANYTIPTDPGDAIMRQSRTACEVRIRPDRICGGQTLTVPANDRAALITYKCKSSSTERVAYRVVKDNNVARFFCDRGD